VIRYFIVRFLSLFVTVLGALILVFGIVRIVPGDPLMIIMGDFAEELSDVQIAQFEAAWGLDKGIHVQFYEYIKGIFRGDLGFSWAQNMRVAELIKSFIGHSLILAIVASAIGLLIGVPLGIVAATHRNSLGDYTSVLAAVVWASAPSFWTSLLLIYLVGYSLDLLPMFGGGYGEGIISQIQHMILPAIALGTRSAGTFARMTRATVLEILGLDYVKTARSKGLSNNKVLYKHVLRNTGIALVTLLGMNLAIDLGATVIIETVFGRPGMGRLMADAMFSRDFPLIQGCAIVFAAFTALMNFLTDLAYPLIDPAVKYD